MSKKSDRMEKYQAMMKKQVELAFKYPFCRRCKKKLDPAWAKELKKQMAIPLCRECFEPMMKKFKENIELWSKFNRR